MKIINIAISDFDEILSLNEAAVPHVNSIGAQELQWFSDNAACTVAATIEQRLAGFLIGLRPGTTYNSPNYQWFCDHREDFAYVDRVVVAEWAQRRGVAESLYDHFASSQKDAPVMTCEVNIRPSNAGSMKYHERLGFQQVGTQETDGGKKEVALLEKML